MSVSVLNKLSTLSFSKADLVAQSVEQYMVFYPFEYPIYNNVL